MPFRTVGPAALELFRRNGSVIIDIKIDLGPGNVWHGVAAFPGLLEREADALLDEVETPNDLENLVRAWSDEDTWASYQKFRNVNGF